MSQTIITLQYGDFPVFFQENAFINATNIARLFNKQARDYLNHEQTIRFVESLKHYALKDKNQLIIERRESDTQEQGTWLHPYLAVDFARWLAVDFAIWCEKQIELMLHTTKSHLTSPQEKNTRPEMTSQMDINTPAIAQSVPEGMVIIAAKRYQQLQKIAGLTTFDHIKEMVEENGGKVLLKSEFDKIKDLLNL